MEKNQSIGSIQTHEEIVEGLSMVFSTGSLARRAGGAVTVQLCESVVLVAVTAAAKASPDQGYFPLGVEYREKFCAAGRFPGGYVRREGRPSEKEILTARLCDRPLRPLFPKGFRNEVQVVGLLLAADLKNEPDVLMVNGASAALMCSDIPWNGPIGCVRVGEIGGEFIVNPTNEELYESNLDLLYVGSCDRMMMVEGSADQIPESRFIEALEFAQRSIQPIIAAQRRLAQKVSKAKMDFVRFVAPEEIVDHCRPLFADELRAAMAMTNQREADGAVTLIYEKAAAAVVEKFGEGVPRHAISMAIDELRESICRSEVLDHGHRFDGRAIDGLRRIGCDVGFLPRVHGISLFQRGETQAMVSVTLGTSRDAQSLDGITGGTNEKSFILHYNFPPFSVGETGRFGTPGRREIGHGALAERSLLPVIPDAETFPYSIRLVSEILESNGSSSMATVCAGTAAMMDAGIPILAPVAGISMGLVTGADADAYVILTDITGLEDHFGDMDFKIAGTEAGITGFQLDLKIGGLQLDIAAEAIGRSRLERIKILEAIKKTIANPREELRPCAPHMRQLQISSEKIGALIGPGGKNIKRIVDETGAQVNVCQDNSGKVSVFATTKEAMDAAVAEIEAMNSEIEVGKTYRGIVRGVKEFGAFVECLPGKEGLVHISELDFGRVENVEDVCKVGDEIVVCCVGADEKGRVRLSRKAAICAARGIPYESSAPSANGGSGRERREGGRGGGGGGGFRRDGGSGRFSRDRGSRDDRLRPRGRPMDEGRGGRSYGRGDD